VYRVTRTYPARLARLDNPNRSYPSLLLHSLFFASLNTLTSHTADAVASVIIQLTDILKTIMARKAPHPSSALSPKLPAVLDAFVPLLVNPSFSFLPDPLLWLAPLFSAYGITHSTALVTSNWGGYFSRQLTFFYIPCKGTTSFGFRSSSAQSTLPCIARYEPLRCGGFGSFALFGKSCQRRSPLVLAPPDVRSNIRHAYSSPSLPPQTS